MQLTITDVVFCLLRFYAPTSTETVFYPLYTELSNSLANHGVKGLGMDAV
jgi:hypothetical protein